MSTTLPFKNQKIFIFDYKGPRIECGHLATLIGYRQRRSLKRQALDVASRISRDEYICTENAEIHRQYEKEWKKHMGAPMTLPKAEVLFLSPSAVQKVLSRTKYDTAKLTTALEDGGFLPKEANGGLPLRTLQMDAYHILERLLTHLEKLESPALRELAVVSAEIGLHEKLKEIRSALATGVSGEPTTLIPHLVAEAKKRLRDLHTSEEVVGAQLFRKTNEKYYGLKEIGQRAGGYSAIQAGKAADLVAARMGYSRRDIRHKKLPFNAFPVLPDTNGKPRRMYRFNANFANKVIRELRNNPRFTPQLLEFKTQPDLPNLMQGPFENN